MDVFLSAFALMLVFEGVLPFLSPKLYRRLMCQLITLRDRSFRITGLVIMLVGAAILYALHA